MSRRARHRRAQRDADRSCATAADLERLDRLFRILPADFPSFVRAVNRAKEAGRRLSQAQIDELLGAVIEVSWGRAAPLLRCVRQSRAFRRWRLHLGTHPGPESSLAPEILVLALILAVEEKGRATRTVVCRVVNGMDSRIWHSAGMCTRTTRTPVSFNVVERQMQRIEQFPEIGDLPEIERLPDTAHTPLRLPPETNQ